MQRGHHVVLRDPDATLLEFLDETRPDVVWPALHGASGEDGALRSLLDMLGVAYVGSQGKSARLAWQKPTAKVLVERAGLSTPRWVTLPRDTFRELGCDAGSRTRVGVPGIRPRDQAGHGRLRLGRRSDRVSR